MPTDPETAPSNIVSRPPAAYRQRQCKCDIDTMCMIGIPVFFVASLAAMITCAVIAGVRIVDCPVATCNVTDASVLPVRFACTTATGTTLVDQPAGPVYAYTPGRVYRALGCALTLYGDRNENAIIDGQYRVWPYLAWQTAYVLDGTAAQPGTRWTPVTADDATALDGPALALRTISGMQCVWGAAWLSGVVLLGAVLTGIAWCVCGLPGCRTP